MEPLSLDKITFLAVKLFGSSLPRKHTLIKARKLNQGCTPALIVEP